MGKIYEWICPECGIIDPWEVSGNETCEKCGSPVRCVSYEPADAEYIKKHTDKIMELFSIRTYNVEGNEVTIIKETKNRREKITNIVTELIDQSKVRGKHEKSE